MRRHAVLMLSLLALSSLAVAQAKKPEHATVASALDGSVKGVEHEFVSAAEAMPEDKFNFAPSNGEFKDVRTFAQQVKHVAAVNYVFGSSILGEKPPVDTGGESGPAAMNSKADIVKFLKDSFEYAHKAVASINNQNMVASIKSPFGGTTTRLAMATGICSHVSDHYGQVVEYLRMNGIVPPASRR